MATGAPDISPSNRVRIVVATSVMLTFISYWRAAAIVLNDLGSSAFYAAGIAEQAIGKSAPWFIVAVMLFSFTVRAVYVESCSMFVRGGVYRVVKEALGGTLAKMSVFAGAVTIYFWWQNTKGIQESSEKALRVMQITTVMVVLLLGWSAITLLKQGYQPVPLPTGRNLQ